MGAWGEESLANDSGSDLKYSILRKLGIDEDSIDDSDCEDCSFLTSKDLKRSFSSMITDLLNSAKKELSDYGQTHEAHCIAQFVIQNNVKLLKGDKKILIDLLGKEDYGDWVNPERRKTVTKNVIRDLRRM